MSDRRAGAPEVVRRDWLEAPEGLVSAPGGVTAPGGFRAGASACGLKPSGALDVGVLACERECTSAMVDTASALPSAAVMRNREAVTRSAIRAVVVNAGTANAATGSPGVDDAARMAAVAGVALDLSPSRIVVCSTGTIGDRLDMPRIERGIVEAVSARAAAVDDGGFGRAIQTTDRSEKRAAFRLDCGPGAPVTIGIAAKGAGMIRPDMATMLAFVTTDAAIDPEDLAGMTSAAAAGAFNRISVDGQTSPSDTLVTMASGSGPPATGAERDRIAAAVRAVCRWAAIQMVKDGEGATHAVRLRVEGAASAEEAEAVARAIGDSPLVKTAVFGGDPNWGRVEQAVGMALAGRGGRPASVTASIDGVDIDDEDAVAVMRRPEYDLGVGLGRGEAATELFFCDLTHDYVSLNAAYHT